MCVLGVVYLVEKVVCTPNQSGYMRDQLGALVPKASIVDRYSMSCVHVTIDRRRAVFL